ncbi:Rho termination factor N-terminal domain-containing protein [Streptomyces sp. NPDC093591]|uniref:Rho termination factor N-terminal domain-containing protein n=1 Tax=Streptomyces sp. NPDC093591 TaxID=3366044 RepID=UPI0038068624
MVVAELQQIAAALGIKGAARMRKAQLIELIRDAQDGAPPPGHAGSPLPPLHPPSPRPPLLALLPGAKRS